METRRAGLSREVSLARFPPGRALGCHRLTLHDVLACISRECVNSETRSFSVNARTVLLVARSPATPLREDSRELWIHLHVAHVSPFSRVRWDVSPFGGSRNRGSEKQDEVMVQGRVPGRRSPRIPAQACLLPKAGVWPDLDTGSREREGGPWRGPAWESRGSLFCAAYKSRPWL